MGKISEIAYKMRRSTFDEEVEIASGVANGTEFQIFLKSSTHDENALIFATPGGFGQHGLHALGIFKAVINKLINLTYLNEPSVNLIELRAEQPLKAVVLCTVAQSSEFYVSNFGNRGSAFDLLGPIWRDYYYSMYYAAVELLANNFHNRIYLSSISHNRYQSSEVKCAIESFIHYSRQSQQKSLQLVIGGRPYFEYHPRGYDYLDSLAELVQDALVSEHRLVETRNLSNLGQFSIEERKWLNLQRRQVTVPIKVSSSFSYSQLTRH